METTPRIKQPSSRRRNVTPPIGSPGYQVHPRTKQQLDKSLSSSNEDDNESFYDNINLTDNNSDTGSISLYDLRISFKTLAVTTATTQISSLVFCLAWSVKFNFYESTATHCQVANYLPSLSATLDFTPQRDVWRTCIGLSGVPRYLIAYLYYKIIFESKPLLWLHWIEITALIGLSIVDSIRYFSKYLNVTR